MHVMIVHDTRGKIISIGRLERQPDQSGLRVEGGLTPARGQSVMELDIVGQLAKMSLSDIQREFVVDLKAKELKKRAQKGKRYSSR